MTIFLAAYVPLQVDVAFVFTTVLTLALSPLLADETECSRCTLR